jgi:glycosyltransferase involved in cell wall biosynthesis
VPLDEVGRRREMGLPEGYVVLAGGPSASDGLDAGLRAVVSSGVELPVVVIDVEEGAETAVAELGAAAGLTASALHARGSLPSIDRAAVYAGAVALVAPSTRAAFPWRVVDALTLGVPVLGTSSAVHEEIVLDGGVVTAQEELGAALASALRSTASAERLAVLAADRGRAFSWREAADKVWGLHADL